MKKHQKYYFQSDILAQKASPALHGVGLALLIDFLIWFDCQNAMSLV